MNVLTVVEPGWQRGLAMANHALPVSLCAAAGHHYHAAPVATTGGWRFHRSSWGHGFATEAGRGLVDALFQHGASRVFAQTMAVNERSREVMDRIGLLHVRTFHPVFDDPLPGTELGEVEYELLRSDWEAQPRGSRPAS